MRNYFTFGSFDSRNYGVYLSGSGVFNAPERSVNFINVPGRNGAVIGNEKRFENIELTYPAYIYSDFKNKISQLRSALLSISSYAKLTDSYHTDEFRQAIFTGAMKVSTSPMLNAGRFDITFICKPQRWLNSGESESIIYNSGGQSYNPTKFDALPKLTIYGYGDVYVGSQKITVQNAYGSVVIDSEVGDCYSGTENANSVVTFGDRHFPVLEPGANVITFPATVDHVSVVPRWWRV